MSYGGAVTGVYNTNQTPHETYNKNLQIYTPMLTDDEYRKNLLIAIGVFAIILLIIYLLQRSKVIEGTPLIITVSLVAGIGGTYLIRERNRLKWYVSRSENAAKPDPSTAALMLKNHSNTSLIGGFWNVCHTIDYWYYMDSQQMGEAATQYKKWTKKNAIDKFKEWKETQPCKIGQDDKIKKILQSIIDRL